jgi:hypothetical protein
LIEYNPIERYLGKLGNLRAKVPFAKVQLKPEKSFLDRRTGAAGLTRAVFESGDLDKITLHDLEQFIHPLCSLWLILLDLG